MLHLFSFQLSFSLLPLCFFFMADFQSSDNIFRLYGGIFLHLAVYFDFLKVLAKDLFLSSLYPGRKICDQKILLAVLAVRSFGLARFCQGFLTLCPNTVCLEASFFPLGHVVKFIYNDPHFDFLFQLFKSAFFPKAPLALLNTTKF